jgi:hypothetical protein
MKRRGKVPRQFPLPRKIIRWFGGNSRYERQGHNGNMVDGKGAASTQVGEMELNNIERRRAERYPAEAKVVIRKENGEPISAVALDISSSGMLVHLDEPMTFHPGAEVGVEVESYPYPGKPFSPWGIATVIRVDDKRFGVQLRAGSFHQSAEEPEED